MGNLGETKTIDKIVVEIGSKKFVFAGGGSGQPAADSVGSKEIKDGSVEMQDLDPRIITTTQEARDIVTRAISKEE